MPRPLGERVGVVLRLAKSGKLIIKLERLPPAGAFLIDDRGRRVGRVLEVFGPVKAPYASVQPMSDRLRGLIGRPVFLEGRGRG